MLNALHRPCCQVVLVLRDKQPAQAVALFGIVCNADFGAAVFGQGFTHAVVRIFGIRVRGLRYTFYIVLFRF